MDDTESGDGWSTEEPQALVGEPPWGVPPGHHTASTMCCPMPPRPS